MVKTHKGISAYPIFIAVFVIIAALASTDYFYFSSRLKKTARCDDLTNHFATIRTSILDLEYTLDMFIVARRFEDTTVSLIKRDVESLDHIIGVVTRDRGYAELAEENTLLKEGFAAIRDHWASIVAEVEVMSEAISQEEALLIHNEVDVNTILIRDVTERLIDVVTGSKKALLWELEYLLVLNIVALFVFWGAVSLLIYRKLVRPVKRATDTAGRIASGDHAVRFDTGDGGFTRPLKAGLNSMLDSLAAAELDRAGLVREADRRKADAVAQVEALGRLTARAGRSLSRADIYEAGLAEVMENTGAEAAAVYMLEDGALRLKAHKGLPDELLKLSSVISEENLRDIPPAEGSRVYTDLKRLADAEFSSKLRSAGFKAMATAQVDHGGPFKGVVSALYRAPERLERSVGPFLGAVAANVGVFFAYIDLFQVEYSVKKFLERVFNQIPIGVAVFDRTGVCLYVNNNLKGILGAGPDSGVVGGYNVVEDAVLKRQGMLPSIQKSYEGYTTEFIINYDPGLIEGLKLKGAQKRLKLRSIPLYDEGGEISSIALLYEDLTGTDGPDETPAGAD